MSAQLQHPPRAQSHPVSAPVTSPPPARARDRALDALVLLFSLAALTIGGWRYGLYEPHEGHFAGVAREMALSGDWLEPHLNGSPYLNKPPLMYVSIAVIYRLTGRIDELAPRLVAGFYGWLGVVAAWLFARAVWGRRAGVIAAATLSASAGWFIFTHQVMTDILLSTLSLWGLYLAWRCVTEPERRGPWVAFYAVLALGSLNKGPVGPVFPCLALFGWIAIERRWDLLRRSRWWLGLTLAAAPTFAWGLFIESRHPGFWRHIIGNELVARIVDKRWPPDYRVSSTSPLGYLIVTAIWLAPWTLLAPQTMAFAARALRRVAPGSAAPPERAAVGLLLIGFLGPILFFLPMPSRLIYYCLPAAGPFAVLCAGWLASLERKGSAGLLGARVGGWMFTAIGYVALTAGLWVPGLVADVPEMRLTPGTLRFITPMSILVGLGLVGAGAGMLAWRTMIGAVAGLAFFGSGWVYACGGFEAFEDIRSSRRMVRELDGKLGPGAIWISEGSKEMGASAGIGFYLRPDGAGKPRVVRVMDEDERRPQPRFADAPRDWAMTRDELDLVWDGPTPAVFVTDMMRQDFIEDPPRLPSHAGDPVGEYGFRRVYLNAAAAKWIEAIDQNRR